MMRLPSTSAAMTARRAFMGNSSVWCEIVQRSHRHGRASLMQVNGDDLDGEFALDVADGNLRPERLCDLSPLATKENPHAEAVIRERKRRGSGAILFGRLPGRSRQL